MQGPQGPAGVITLPNGEKSIPVTSVPADQRLVVDQVTFSPNPIRSRTEPITVRVKVKDTRGFVVRDAHRVPPLDAARDPERAGPADGQDGWLQLTVTPERDFPSSGRRTPCSSSSRRPARATPSSPASPATGSSRCRSARRREQSEDGVAACRRHPLHTSLSRYW